MLWTKVDILRDSIIDKLLTISNEDFLTTLYQLIDKSSVENNVIELTDEQIIMLKLSEEDIENCRFLSNEQLNIEDKKWLSELHLPWR